ncbi:MAG: GNAT family N-acetyltransferase [Rubrimonas sp.]|uniref:GNAT family N-acetyltransferase n=1 Tax=Rubrimonas sp. TaxID=2036015 RepID=UPI002FDE7143
MGVFLRGRYGVRLAESIADVRAAQRLRFRAFIEGRDTPLEGPRAAGLDADDLDALCDHMLIEDRRSGELVCCFRMLPLDDGSQIARTYSARYYDLSALKDYPERMVEMGRFCIAPEHRGDPDVLRSAWGAMTDYVEKNAVGMLFGCSSFHGVDEDEYMDAFALLKERHLAPPRWLPRVKAPKVFRFALKLRLKRPDMKLAMRRMPPLLRTYLVMGGWVSDHAVIDHDLNTLHVFTGVEIARVPPSRARLLKGA